MPNTDYRYRIDARGEHSPLDIDNNSKAARNEYNLRFTTGSQAHQPYIDLDSSGVSTWSGDPFGTNTEIRVIVHDAQGVPDNIQSVTALTPDNATVPLFLYRKESETRAAYLGWTFAPPQSGAYSITVKDKDGNSYTKKEHLEADPLGYPAADSLSVSYNNTAYHLDWDDVNGTAFYRVEAYDINQNRIETFATTTSEYTIPEGFLKPGELYRYRITSRREFFDQNVDNVSVAPWFYTSRPTLVHEPFAGNNPPQIRLDQDNFGVAVWHTKNPATDISNYWLFYDVLVRDADGLPENGLQVVATAPDGHNATLHLDTLHNATAATYEGIEVYDDLNNVPQGIYTFSATDGDGLSDSLTDELSIDSVPLPVNASPAAGAVVNGISPAIDWDDVAGADVYRVKIYSDWDLFVHHSDYLTQSTYTVPAGTLEPGKVYNYRVNAYREHYPDKDYDNIASTMLLPGIRPYFTIQEPSLELDGPGFDFDTKGFTPWGQGGDLTYTTAFNATGSFEAWTLIKDEGVNNLDQVDTWDHSQGGDFAPLPEVGHVYTLETDRGLVYALKVNAIQETPKAVVFAYKRLGPVFGLADVVKILQAQSGLAFESPPFDTNRNRRNDLGDAVFMLKELSRAQP